MDLRTLDLRCIVQAFSTMGELLYLCHSAELAGYEWRSATESARLAPFDSHWSAAKAIVQTCLDEYREVDAKTIRITPLG